MVPTLVRATLLIACAAVPALASAAPASAAASTVPSPSISEMRLPLSFELNHGQAQAEIKALSRGRGYGLLLTATEAVLVATDGKEQAALRFRMVGSNPAPAVSGLEALPGTVSYFVGNDPGKWHSGIGTYAKVKYDAVYPGIDLIYYGNQRQLEYDFIVAPGADPFAIRLEVSGARKIHLAESGDLALETTSGTVVHRKPFLYQDIDGQRRAVAGRFLLRNHNQVSFDVGEYDRRYALVIDPTLSFFTYFGDAGTDQIKAVSVSSPSGLTFFAGLTTSTTLPSAGNTSGGGTAEGFISAMGANGTSILLTLFIGGSGTDLVNGIALDPAAVPTFLAVAGVTNSTDFPTMGAAQPSIGGSYDGFVARFAIALPVGGLPTATMTFSTYLGGLNVDLANGVAVSNAATGSAIFVTGGTLSTGFPTSNAFQTVKGGSYDAFLTKYNSDGTVAYSTFWGGLGSEVATGVAVWNKTAPVEAVPFVTGTLSIPSSRSLAFVFSMAANGSAMSYSKVLGAATAKTTSNGIAVDTSGSAYIAGDTNDAAFPVVSAVQPTYGGNTDAFVAKLNATGTAIFATYYGGTGLDRAYSIAVDTFTGGNNNIIIGGMTSGAFPATAIQTTYGGGAVDGFVVLMAGPTYSLGYATYLGGLGADIVYSVCVGSAHNARVAGITNSAGLSTAGVAQGALAGAYDGFVAFLRTTP